MFARIANILGWFGVALVFAAVAARFLRPEMMNLWWWLAISGLVAILVYVLSQWREIVAAFSGRQGRYGTLSLVSVIVVLGILVGINYIAQRQNKRWDLTASQEFTLSDQTRKVIQNLKQPLKLIVFEREERMAPFRDRLGEYTYTSKNLQVEYIDPDKQPAMARQYQIQNYGTVAVEHQGRTERVTGTSEQDITNAIIKAVQGQQRKVYFVTGHGEHDPGSSDERAGYSAISEALKRDNFLVESLPLLQKLDIPADAAALVVAGPTTDLLQPELDALRKYVGRGGKLMLLVDPVIGPNAKPLSNLVAFAAEWGIEIADNIVVDPNPVGQLLGLGPDSPVAGPPYPAHAITERFRLNTAYPLVRSVLPATTAPPGRTAQTIVNSGPSAWGETDLKALTERRPVKFDEGADRQGPVSLAAAVSAPAADAATPTPAAAGAEAPPKPESRVAVFGDSDFAANLGIGIEGNADLFLNTVNWLVQQENLIAIRPKQPDDRRVTLTAEQQQWVAWFSVLLLPGAVIAAGVYTWWRRRG
jgi:ABC-type uncharacterized transport system involved in gliding motility auxiliary subunit